MNNTKIALELIRCTRMSVQHPAAVEAIAAGLATVKQGQVRLTPVGHAVLRSK